MANSIWLAFADGEYFAHLKNKRIAEVEAKCEAGLGDIYGRSMSGMYRDTEGEWVIQPFEAKWRNAELAEVVRQGFIGGALCKIDGEEKPVTPHRINELLINYLDEQPRIELWKLAAAILHATMEGYEAPGEAVAPAKGAAGDSQSSDPQDTPDM
jgi:hypothetical protein